MVHLKLISANYQYKSLQAFILNRYFPIQLIYILLRQLLQQFQNRHLLVRVQIQQFMEQKQSTNEITKLQKQIADFQRQLNIEVKQKDIVKDYKMKQGDYQILITVYEANQLMPRGTDFYLFKTNKTACDAFVEIQIRDQIQRTSVKQDTNNPIFDQKFYFKFQALTLEQLDRSSISFKLYDRKRLAFFNSVIGSFEMDWTNVYFKRNHEIYRGWLTLMDPYDVQEGVMGYLLVSVAVLGVDDKVTVHDSAFIKDPLTTIEDTVTMPKLQLIDYGINIQIYRAENLIPLDEFKGNVDAYVIAKFSGNKMDTSVKSSCNPQWDQLIKLGTGVPTKSKYVILQVRNRNFLFGDDIIGVLKIPFIDLQQNSQPRWGHLYGPPVTGKDYEPYNYATKMQVYGTQIGSHYRGRLLYKITGQKDIINKNSRSKINFKFPFKPTPVVPLKSYTLRLQILDGFNLPEIKGKNQCYIHCCIGQYMIVSRSFGQLKNRSLTFLQKLPDKKVQMPEDITQIPDLIIYLAKGQKQRDRISFVRIPAQYIVTSSQSNPMTIYNLKADLTLNNIGKDQSGGFITTRAHIFVGQPPQAKNLIAQFGKKANFLVKIFLYRARNLPPMNESGDCDPKLVFHFCGAQKQVISNSTYNPIWNDIIDLQVETEDIMSVQLEKALICNVYDRDQNAKDNLIGNIMMKLSKKNKRKYQGYNRKVDFLYQKPKWYPILNEKVNIGDPCFGHILMGCAIFRKEDLLQFNHRQIKMSQQLDETKTFQLFMLGARGLQAASKHIENRFISFQILVGKSQSSKSKEAQVKLSSANINQMLTFSVGVPKNKCIIPYVDIKVFEHKNGTKKFIGFSSISLYDLVPKIALNYKKNSDKQQQDQEDFSQQTLLDLDEIQRQLNVVKQRKRKRVQALLRQGQKQKHNNEVNEIQKMPVPKQLASTDINTDEQTQKNAKLEQLLQKFEEQYDQDPNYDYVGNLQSQMDRKSQSIVSQKKISDFNLNPSSQHGFKEQSDEQQQSLKQQLTNTKLIKNQLTTVTKFSMDPNGTQTKQKIKKSKVSKSNLKLSQKPNYRQSKLNQYIFNGSEEEARKNLIDLSSRFTVDFDVKRKLAIIEEQQQKTVTNFDLDVHEDIKQVEHDQRAINYADLERIIKEEEKFTKEAMERQENYKYAAAVKLSLFKWKQQKKQIDPETYQDYDTDVQEVLDIIPEWYKGRKILVTDFEQLVPSKKILSLPIYQGGERIAELDIRQKKVVGHLKCIGLSLDDQLISLKQDKYLKLLKPRSYVCRVYILKGKSLISNFNKKPTTYLRISCKGEVFDLKSTTLREEQYNPQYYVCQQIPMEIPGSSTVKIEVMEAREKIKVYKSDQVLGYTQIDMEQRHFTKKWHLFTEKKPIELRNLYSQYGSGTQGRLQVWVDIIQKKNWLSNPPFKIHPPPFDKFELRVIVWSTKQCVYKNEAFKSNDVYVRGFLGTSQAQQTDTHWACRGVGNFNYRFKYDVSYPLKPEDMYSDQFVIQIWDRDVVGYNNLIGEKRINLNKIHRIIEKAVKRKKPVKAKMKIREQGLALTEKFWFDVYNHKMKDEFGQLQSQGKVQLSFQLVPKAMAENNVKNGLGRSEPNLYPTLPQPAGRLSFNILHPLDFFKQLCGPQLYNKFCHKILCCFVLIVIALLMYFVLGQVIAAAIVSK